MNLIGIGSFEIPLKTTQTKATKQSLLPEKFDVRKLFHQFANHFPPHLRWISFYNAGSLAAEVLMSAEFVQLQSPTLIARNLETNEQIPEEIRPEMKKFRMEVTFVGVRDATKLSLFGCGRFRVELIMGELKLSSGFSSESAKSNMSFLDPHASGYLMLPEQTHYWPSIIFKYLESSHKRPTVIGGAMIRRPEKFYVKEKPKELQRFLLSSPVADEAQETVEMFEIEERQPLLGNEKRNARITWRKALGKITNVSGMFGSNQSFHQLNPITLESEFTWWTKFYNSNRKPEFRNDCLQNLTVNSLHFLISLIELIF